MMQVNEFGRVSLFKFTGGSVARIIGFAAVLVSGCGAKDDTREARAVTELTAELAPVVHGNNEFAWKLYREAAGAPGNLFFSPFSISAALAMTYAGAGGETAAQMREVLSIKPGDAAYHAEFGALIRDLSGAERGRGYELLIANRLFGAKGLTFQAEFRGTTQNDYGAPLETLNFADDAARQHINGWVGEQTRGKIPELIEGELDASTWLVLVNAIYFNARWAHRFDARATAARTFRLLDGTSVQVPTMANTGDYRCASSPTERVIELPYEDDEIGMMIVVPVASDGLAALETTLNAERVEGWTSTLRDCEVRLQLPRFEVEATLPAKRLLEAMGMQLAFTSRADFSKLLDPVMSVLIDDVLHKAYVQVDERGTEAAAATSVSIRPVSAPPEFVVDAPFLYFIRDRLTGAILFVGRMTDPRPANAG